MHAEKGLNSYSGVPADPWLGLLTWEDLVVDLNYAVTLEQKREALSRLYACAFGVPTEMVYRSSATPTPTRRETMMEAKVFCEDCEASDWVDLDEYDGDRLSDCISDDHIEDYTVVKLDDPEEVTDEPDLFDLPCSYPDLLEQIDVIESIPCYINHDVVLAWLRNTGEKITGFSTGEFEESYNGTWYDEEEFARDFAESIGAIDNDPSWPYNSIDWESATWELMFDYWSERVSGGVAIFSNY